MSTKLAEHRGPNWIALAPWPLIILIGTVFFYTGHDVFRSRYILERGVEMFNPTDEEAEEILEQFQRGTPGKAVAYVILGVFGALVLGVRTMQRRFHVNGLLGGVSLLFALWSFMSIIWADDRLITFNKIAVLAMVCLGALGAAQIFREEDLLLLAVTCTAVYLAVGVASEVALGAFQPWVAGYRFSGTIHPNGQGLNCAMLFLAALGMRRADEEHKRWWTLLMLAALVFLVLTKSRTPIGLVMFSLLLFWAWRLPLPGKVFLAALTGLVLCTLLILGDTMFPALREALRFGRTDILETGGSTTLQGRLDLWVACWPYITDKLLLGHGYNSFWTVSNTFHLAASAGWIAGSAHSIYVDVLLGLGFIGLAGFVIMLLLALRRLLAMYALEHRPAHVFLICFFLFALAHGVLESTFIFPGLHSFLLIVATAYLGFRVPDEYQSVAVALPPRGARKMSTGPVVSGTGA